MATWINLFAFIYIFSIYKMEGIMQEEPKQLPSVKDHINSHVFIKWF